MAKVLHAADFHLDSAFRSLPEEQARLRRQESRELPGRLVFLPLWGDAGLLVA